MRRGQAALLALAALALGTAARGQRPQTVATGDDSELRAAVERRSVHDLLAVAELRTRRGDLAGAAEPLRRALDLAPNSERVLASYARTAMAARAPTSAMIGLEHLVRMYPDTAEYAYLLGVARMQVGENVLALPELERALALAPHRPLTLAAIGTANNNLNRYPEAKAALDEALRLAPEDAEVLAALAEAEEGLGDTAAAEAHALAALQRARHHPAAHLVVALVRMREERYEEARRSLEAALVAAPDSAKLHYHLNLACARLGDRECAARHVDLYRKALREAEEAVEDLRKPMEGGSSR